MSKTAGVDIVKLGVYTRGRSDWRRGGEIAGVDTVKLGIYTRGRSDCRRRGEIAGAETIKLDFYTRGRTKWRQGSKTRVRTPSNSAFTPASGQYWRKSRKKVAQSATQKIYRRCAPSKNYL